VDTQALAQTEVCLPENNRSATLAREFTRETMTRWGRHGWHDAAQVASELVSNVLLHAHGQPVLRLQDLGDDVLIEVCDDSPLPPTPGGLGLQLVDRMATRWGVSRQGRGKVVWCLLPAVPNQMSA
jgi:hypothetical protein